MRKLLILITILGGGYQYYPHLKDEETEAQGRKYFFPCLNRLQMAGSGFKPRHSGKVYPKFLIW